MVAASGFSHQFQVTGNLTPFAFGADASVAMLPGIFAVVNVAAPQQGIDFAVGNNHLAQGLCTEHGFQHHVVRLDTPSVIGEGDTVCCHAFQICKDFTLFLYGDGAVGIYMNAGRGLNQLQLLIQMCHAVRNGI